MSRPTLTITAWQKRGILGYSRDKGKPSLASHKLWVEALESVGEDTRQLYSACPKHQSACSCRTLKKTVSDTIICPHKRKAKDTIFPHRNCLQDSYVKLGDLPGPKTSLSNSNTSTVAVQYTLCHQFSLRLRCTFI